MCVFSQPFSKFGILGTFAQLLLRHEMRYLLIAEISQKITLARPFASASQAILSQVALDLRAAW